MNCPVCNDIIYFRTSNNQKLCGKPSCKEIAKQASQRIIRQRKQLEVILEGRVCKRCQQLVHEQGMKKYCKECSEIMGTYQKKVFLTKVCKTCPTKIVKRKVYCDECNEIRQKAMKKNQRPTKEPVDISKWTAPRGSNRRVE